jgi:hypothetical protein
VVAWTVAESLFSVHCIRLHFSLENVFRGITKCRMT